MGELWQAHFCLAKSDNSEFTLTEARSAADAFMNGFGGGPAALMPFYGPNVTFQPMKVEELSETTGKVVNRTSGTVGATPSGSGSAAQLPHGVACAISLKGFFAGPKFRGRFFLPPPISTAVGPNGEMTAAFQNALQAAVGNGFTLMSGILGTLGIMAIQQKDLTIVPVKLGTVGNVFDSMRSRRNKLVENRKVIALGTPL